MPEMTSVFRGRRTREEDIFLHKTNRRHRIPTKAVHETYINCQSKEPHPPYSDEMYLHVFPTERLLEVTCDIFCMKFLRANGHIMFIGPITVCSWDPQTERTRYTDVLICLLCHSLYQPNLGDTWARPCRQESELDKRHERNLGVPVGQPPSRIVVK
jgi:hypothetical protein